MSDVFNANLMSRLAHFGIEEPWQLIMNLPNSYDDFIKPVTSIAAIKKIPDGQYFYGCLILSGVSTSDEMERMRAASGQEVRKAQVPYVEIKMTDGSGKLNGRVFGAVRDWINRRKDLTGKKVFFYAKKGSYNNFPQISDARIVPAEQQGRLVPRYSGKEKIISPDKVSECTDIAMMHYMDDCVNHLIDTFGEDEHDVLAICRAEFHSFKHLMTTVHKPRTREDLNKALLALRRLNAYYGLREAMSNTFREMVPEAAITVDTDLIRDLVEKHPFTPTKDQRKAIWEIVKDLASETPMDRLLSADVGNGKTMAYGIPAAYAASKKRNVVILLPTQPLAGQVAANIKSWYPDLNIHLVTPDYKEQVIRGDILIGTTAVLSWMKKNPQWVPDLAIVDEQQKMGSQQISSMLSKQTHLLEATATPIPRTMALTMFGGKKVSIIRDSPVKKTIHTTLLGNEEGPTREAMALMRHMVLKEGKKIAFIYPLVAEQDSYSYHIDAATKKEAERIVKGFRKAGATVKQLKEVSDENSPDKNANVPEKGFMAEIWAEESVFNRLNKRMQKYFEADIERVTFLGQKVDPAIEERNQKTILRAAERWEKIFPGRVAVIHGRSTQAEKDRIIDDMNAGKADVLLSTTLIEIGIDIKDLAALGVRDAENLGAFTLHQLRGRVVRNGGEGHFFMIASKPLQDLDDAARDRMNLLVRYTSGEEIALHDMSQRGFGNLSAGSKTQTGFEDGIFPKMKLTAAELEDFLRSIVGSTSAANNPEPA